MRQAISSTRQRVSVALDRCRPNAKRLSFATRAEAAATSGGKKVLITGGNTGIGLATATALVAKGFSVDIACRDAAKAEAAMNSIRQSSPSAQLGYVPLDLANLSSVRDAAKQVLDSGVEYDVLINNAGVMACPKMSTVDGFEYQLGVNHLAHFLFTNMLLPRFQDSKKPVRIINLASAAHQFGKINFDDLMLDKEYDAWKSYGQSKLANVMFSYEMARRLPASSAITVNAVHPGVVNTELGRYMVDGGNSWFMGPLVFVAKKFFKTPEQGAETSVYLASSGEAAGLSSKYWVDCKPQTSSPISYDLETSRKLWEVSVELTKLDAAGLGAPLVEAAAAPSS